MKISCVGLMKLNQQPAHNTLTWNSIERKRRSTQLIFPATLCYPHYTRPTQTQRTSTLVFGVTTDEAQRIIIIISFVCFSSFKLDYYEINKLKKKCVSKLKSTDRLGTSCCWHTTVRYHYDFEKKNCWFLCRDTMRMRFIFILCSVFKQIKNDQSICANLHTTVKVCR